ncbi:MAG: hypothetical protein ABL973_08425 [Micropepsaceae bacterium]
MRKYVTAAATALTLGVLNFAAPAMADQYQPNYGNHGQQGQNQGGNQQYGNPGYGNQGNGQPNYGHNDDGYRQGDRRTEGNFNWNRHEGNFDRWERGWERGGWNNDRHGAVLSYWRLVRRVEQQGYYGVRGLRQSRFGSEYRAFAFNFRGRPVMLRINPYSGRVLNVRNI